MMIRPIREMRYMLTVSVVLFLGSIASAILSGFSQCVLLSVFFLAFIVFILYFARNPKRCIPEGDHLVLAPADGRIQSVMTGKDIRIHIFLSLFDVHVNRIPVGGRIKSIEYQKGKFLPAFSNAAVDQNERNTVQIETRFGFIQFSQIAGRIARRIVCTLEKGQEVRAGEVFGMIRFGSGFELVLPSAVRICVKKGDRVRAGETVLCEF